MSLKTKVKAGNITHLGDARYCAGMGVDWLGFPVHAIDPKMFHEITGWVTGPQFVLEVNGQETGLLPENIASYEVDWLQVSVDQLKRVTPSYGNLIVVMTSAAWNESKDVLLQHQPVIRYLLINGQPDEKLLKEMTDHFPVLLDIQGVDYSLDKILSLPISGINVSGDQELKPGLKDYSELSDILEQLETD